MPIRAIAHGRNFIAPLMSDEEWHSLTRASQSKELQLTMPCCDAKAFPRVSPQGTRHFYHRGLRTCDWKPETPEHIEIKTAITRACADIHQSVTPEARGDGWRADVLTEVTGQNGEKTRIAFEIQWSQQNLETTKARQTKYRECGILCFWFFRKLPSPLDKSYPSWPEEYVGHGRDPRGWIAHDANYLVSEDLPMFEITKGEDRSYRIHLGSHFRALPLPEFVQHVSQGRIVFRPILRRLRDEYLDDLLDDLIRWDAGCGRPIGKSDSLVRCGHWCFSADRSFCPSTFPPNPRMNRFQRMG